ncbi:tubulin nucleotide-binding domain-like protein [Thozetella sp. PMI_491]|nr:tubulin nucleotide-binding domain-like protein [Thozetella sp. PMI_491]
MHEIITLQLGQQSNYLATHFWNTQESYFTYSADEESPINHDIHWRPGIGADGSETFMPRTVIYDLKGGFGSLRKINALYDAADPSRAPESQALWSGAPVVHQQPPIEQSAYQASLDAGTTPAPLTTQAVRYWSDFNRVFYHPRSVVQLHEYELNSALMPFEKWSTGVELFRSLDREHDLLDRDLRPFVEEADQMQGLQVFTSWDDAWGGFASEYLERLRDEYGKTPLWVWGQQEGVRGVSRDKRLLRLANKARTLVEVYKQASILVPLALPAKLPRSVGLDATSLWHSSALMAAALESATLPLRLKGSMTRDSMGSMGDLLNSMGKQSVAGLQMSFRKAPEETSDPRERREHPAHGDDGEGIRLDLDFSPSDQLDSGLGRQNGNHEPRIFSQAVSRRGPGEEAPQDEDRIDQDERNRFRGAYEPVSRKYYSSLAFPILNSFPRIFRDEESEPVEETLSITAALSTDAGVSDRLKLLRTTVTRSIGLEDRETLSNDLAEMADEYHEGWSSGSDEGDDD